MGKRFFAAMVILIQAAPAFAMNCYSEPLPGFMPMAIAPRDGTVIELQSTFGIAQNYELSKWAPVSSWITEKAWIDVTPSSAGAFYKDENCLSWRPFHGIQADYKEPDGLTDTQRECAALGLEAGPNDKFCKPQPWWKFW